MVAEAENLLRSVLDLAQQSQAGNTVLVRNLQLYPLLLGLEMSKLHTRPTKTILTTDRGQTVDTHHATSHNEVTS